MRGSRHNPITVSRWSKIGRVNRLRQHVCKPPTDALDLAVCVFRAVGQTDRENLLEAYQEMGKPMRPPEFALIAQPQDLMLWFTIALTVRMDHPQVIGMDPAVLAYLAFLQGPPEGTGDMAHALSKLRANFEL